MYFIYPDREKVANYVQKTEGASRLDESINSEIQRDVTNVYLRQILSYVPYAFSGAVHSIGGFFIGRSVYFVLPVVNLTSFLISTISNYFKEGAKKDNQGHTTCIETVERICRINNIVIPKILFAENLSSADAQALTLSNTIIIDESLVRKEQEFITKVLSHELGHITNNDELRSLFFIFVKLALGILLSFYNLHFYFLFGVFDFLSQIKFAQWRELHAELKGMSLIDNGQEIYCSTYGNGINRINIDNPYCLYKEDDALIRKALSHVSSTHPTDFQTISCLDHQDDNFIDFLKLFFMPMYGDLEKVKAFLRGS